MPLTIRLLSKDREIIRVSLDAVKHMKVPFNMLESFLAEKQDLPDDELQEYLNMDDYLIPVENANVDELFQCIQFIEVFLINDEQRFELRHEYPKVKELVIKTPITHGDLEMFIEDSRNEEYAHFVKSFSIQQAIEFLNAASFLDIQPLVDLLCAKIASMMAGKSTDELKELLYIY